MLRYSIQFLALIGLVQVLAGCATSGDATDMSPGSTTPAPSSDTSGWGLKATGN